MALPHIGAAVPLLREFAGAAAVLAAGAGATAWGALVPRAQLFGRTIRHTGKPGTLALTFDDGPNPALTPRLLRLLEEHHVRATFFLIGRFVRECPSLVAEIAAQGHTIGNHTYTHPRLFWMTPAQIADELARCQDAIHQVCGQRPVWMRPPFGIRGPHLSLVVRRAGFRGVVMWSRWARDWKPKHIATMVERLRRVRGGDVLLLHDGDHRHLRGDRHLTLAALDYWLPMWKNAGLGFVTLDDIAGRRAPVSAPPLQKDLAPAPLRKSSASGE
ncbi:MAG: polysaccharide deacetylase family protein [Acidobacteria bacterium]|nr:polysaccharide deacetylase family protein [Acidobacteriota bacterium]